MRLIYNPRHPLYSPFAQLRLLVFVSMSSNVLPLLDGADELQQLRSLVSYNSDWLWEVDAAGRYTFSSEHSRRILGVAPEEVIGRTPFDFMPPDEAQRVGRLFAGIVGACEPFSGLINRNVHASGAVVVLETSGVPLFAPDGRFAGYRGIDRDVTDSVGPLDSRVTQLEALYEAAPVALAMLDVGSTSIFWTRSEERHETDQLYPSS